MMQEFSPNHEYDPFFRIAYVVKIRTHRVNLIQKILQTMYTSQLKKLCHVMIM